MQNLEAIEKRYLAGSPAKEDIPDLIAEVRRLQNQGAKAPEAHTGPVSPSYFQRKSEVHESPAS